MSETTHQEHGPTQHHQPEKSGNPDTKGFLKGNMKWWLIGGLAVVAVFTFIFVRQSNANSSTTSSGSTGTGTLDPTTNALLQSALSSIASGTGYGYAGSSGGNTAGTSVPSGATSASGGSANSSPVTLRMPNGQLGWDTVTFPSVQAVGEWTAWNAGQTVPGTRSAWNAELQSLGATGYSPLVPYNPNAPLGSPGNTGNPLDTE